MNGQKQTESNETEATESATQMTIEETPKAIDPNHPGQKLTDEQVQQRHDQSVTDYPFIQFLPQEYVAINVVRTSFGYLKNWLAPALISVAIVIGLIIIGNSDNLNYQARREAFMGILILGLALIIITGIAATLATYIFKKNRLVITSERVFRREQLTPFSFNDQNIELSRIEDCSFSQNGPIQQILNYGSITLKTVGDESTYSFDYASDPKDQFQIINVMVQETYDYNSDKR